MFKEMIISLKGRYLAGKTIRFERKLSFHNFKTARNCLLFGVDGDVAKEEMFRLKTLLESYMDVSLLFFSSLKYGQEKNMTDAIYANEASISFGGSFTDHLLRETLENSFDLLIDLSIKRNNFGDYILRHSRAKCKIGMEREGFACDIVFDQVNGMEDFTKRVCNLLSHINAY